MALLKVIPLLFAVGALAGFSLLSSSPYTITQESHTSAVTELRIEEPEEETTPPASDDTPVDEPLPSISNPEVNERVEIRVPALPEEDLVVEESSEASLPFIESATESAVSTQPLYPTEGIFAGANTIARSAVVNIFCQMELPRSIRTVTGSGVMIDPRGIILTNAHIGQFFLLKDYPQENATTCTVRTGNPASAAYHAELIYLPRKWIEDNARQITSTSPRGTGEYDFALLYITEGINRTTPNTFSYIQPEFKATDIEKEVQFIIAGYPAIISKQSAVEEELFQVSALARVLKLFTFSDDTLDLIGLSGSTASYNGSSGGAVANENGRLVGLVVTSTEGTYFGSRELRALTLGYISRAFKEEQHVGLPYFLADNVRTYIQKFQQEEAPRLRERLISEF